jgi:hypothetical protein
MIVAIHAQHQHHPAVAKLHLHVIVLLLVLLVLVYSLDCTIDSMHAMMIAVALLQHQAAVAKCQHLAVVAMQHQAAIHAIHVPMLAVLPISRTCWLAFVPVALLALQAAVTLLQAVVAMLHQAAVAATSLNDSFSMEPKLGKVALTLPSCGFLDSREPDWPSPVGFFYFCDWSDSQTASYRNVRAANSTASINRATSSSVLYR